MAKRVKWWEFPESDSGCHRYQAHLYGDNYLSVLINHDGSFSAMSCRVHGFGTTKEKRFKTLKAAQRHCIREALKLHKLVGTQLTELERGE